MLAVVCAGVGALAVIAFWRFILGFGIGGDYPLSATITSEYANSKWRGAFIASVFAGQVRCWPQVSHVPHRRA